MWIKGHRGNPTQLSGWFTFYEECSRVEITPVKDRESEFIIEFLSLPAGKYALRTPLYSVYCCSKDQLDKVTRIIDEAVTKDTLLDLTTLYNRAPIVSSSPIPKDLNDQIPDGVP